MKPTKHDKVLSWAVELEDQAREQALRASRLPFVAGYIALMPVKVMWRAERLEGDKTNE
jgi:hypothetical protein